MDREKKKPRVKSPGKGINEVDQISGEKTE